MESVVRRGSKLPIVSMVCRWLKYGATMKELLALDAETLKDLGITPYDFRAIASGIYRRPGEHDFAEGLHRSSSQSVALDCRLRARNKTG